MTMEEHGVMISRECQRLRGIKQNGLLHLVFPSATHTRFEHSIGVMHMASGLLEAIRMNSQIERQKEGGMITSSLLAGTGRVIDFSRADDRVQFDVFRVARLAALVHDLGHGPLSHSFDRCALSQSALLPLLSEFGDESRAFLTEIVEAEREKNPGAVSHEVMSCVLFLHYWSRTKHDDDHSWVPLVVAAVVLGRKRVKRPPPSTPPHLVDWVPLIQDIISSAPIDADRLDYIERDSRSCGVSYGIYDRNRLLKSALCYREESGHFRLGWKTSGLRAIEVFIHARFQLFAQIYYHKTNVALGEMIDDIVKGLGETLIVRGSTLAELIDWYVQVDDGAFLRMLADPERVDLDGVNELARRIADRDLLYKRLYEASPAMPARTMLKLLKASRDETLPVRVGSSNLDPTKDLGEGAALLRRDGEGYYAAPTMFDGSEDWFAASPLIRALHDEERRRGSSGPANLKTSTKGSRRTSGGSRGTRTRCGSGLAPLRA